MHKLRLEPARWMLDEYENWREQSLAFITGKPLALGGSTVRDIATALGGVYILEEAGKKIKLEKRSSHPVDLETLEWIWFLLLVLLLALGYTIVHQCPISKGGICDAQGLDMEEAD